MTIGIKAPELKLIITRPTEQQQQQQQQTRAFLFLCVVPACGFYFNHLCFFGGFPLPSPSFVAGNTYNADFDGDEINLHFPQSQLVGCPCVLVARVARVVARVVCSCCCSCCCVHTCVSCDDKFFGITVLGALTPMRTIIYGWHQN